MFRERKYNEIRPSDTDTIEKIDTKKFKLKIVRVTMQVEKHQLP